MSPALLTHHSQGTWVTSGRLLVPGDPASPGQASRVADPLPYLCSFSSPIIHGPAGSMVSVAKVLFGAHLILAILVSVCCTQEPPTSLKGQHCPFSISMK